MDVAFSANRTGVAQHSRHGFDGYPDILLRLGQAFATLELLQGLSGVHGACPCAKILRGEILSADLLEVLIHRVRIDAPSLASVVEVLEQFLAGQVLAASNDRGDPGVRDLHFVLFSALAAEKNRMAPDGLIRT